MWFDQLFGASTPAPISLFCAEV